MKHTDTVIIGGGQAGLAMSRCLAERDVAHRRSLEIIGESRDASGESASGRTWPDSKVQNGFDVAAVAACAIESAVIQRAGSRSISPPCGTRERVGNPICTWRPGRLG